MTEIDALRTLLGLVCWCNVVLQGEILFLKVTLGRKRARTHSRPVRGQGRSLVGWLINPCQPGMELVLLLTTSL